VGYSQHPNQDNLNSVSLKPAGISGIKNYGICENELATNSKNKKIRDLYREKIYMKNC
jgi:hypothetical protein